MASPDDREYQQGDFSQWGADGSRTAINMQPVTSLWEKAVLDLASQSMSVVVPCSYLKSDDPQWHQN